MTTMQSIAYPRRVVLCWAPHHIVIFIYLAFCKRNFQWNLNSSTVVVVVVGFCCVLFDAMSAVFNFNQRRDSGRLSSDPTAAAGTDCLAAWTDAVSSSVVMLLSFCYAQLARFWFIFLPPIPPFRVCVCVWQQPQNDFTSLSFNKLYNIFNLKRNKINLLTIVEQS